MSVVVRPTPVTWRGMAAYMIRAGGRVYGYVHRSDTYPSRWVARKADGGMLYPQGSTFTWTFPTRAAAAQRVTEAAA